MFKKTTAAAVLCAAILSPVFAQTQHCETNTCQAKETVQASSPFMPADQQRLAELLQMEANKPSLVEQVRQQVLANRDKANEQLKALQTITEEKRKAREALTVIDSRSARLHSHGRQYWIAVALVSNGEMQTQVAIATCNGHGYDLHQVKNIHDTPHAVQHQVRHLNHQLVSTFPSHSPELAALSWRTAQLVSSQRTEIDNQLDTLRNFVSSQRTAIEGTLVSAIPFSADHYGEVHSFRVTGTTHGAALGSGVYTSTSHLGVAAVHAGVLKAGETGVVTIRVVEPPSHYLSETRHGVKTYQWSHWNGAFEFVTDSPSDAVNLFASTDQSRLAQQIEIAKVDPVQQIRDQILADRGAVAEQFDTLIEQATTQSTVQTSAGEGH